MTTTLFRAVGPYKISREIGRGVAVVFLATDTRNGREVALKLVPREGDAEAMDLLKAERHGSELQRRFSAISDLVPDVYEWFDVDEYFCIAMEYVPGENLSQTISRGPLAPERAIEVALTLSRFLEAALGFACTIDGKGYSSLLHGDLKPRNIRVTPDGQTKVLDFGIAKALSLTRSATLSDFHSLTYSSPERLDSGTIDPQAEFWALGVILYEMLAGSPPFRAPTAPMLERLIATRSVPPLPASIPSGIRAVIGKLLAPSVEQRYPTASAIRDDLERCLDGAQPAAEMDGWAAPRDEEATRRTRPVETDQEPTRKTSPAIDADATARTTAPVGTPVAAKPRRRRLRAALVIVALFVAAHEACIGRAAGRTAARVQTLELATLPAAWAEYEKLSEQSYFGAPVSTLRRRLSARTQQLAGRVFDNYRMPEPTVRESDWLAARDALGRALAASPDDKQIQAAFRYCEGQLHRINGEQRVAEGNRRTAQLNFTAAVTAFREAAELRSDWPDPFLGLFRTFIKMDDIDRGTAALTQAQRLGYTQTDRETAQLGDGYRARGAALYRASRQVQGMPQEEEHLRRALQAYEEALKHYNRVAGFGNAAANIRLSQREVDRINARLAEIDAVGEIQSALAALIGRWL